MRQKARYFRFVLWRVSIILALSAGIVAPAVLCADEGDPHEADHEALRGLRKVAEEAINNNKLELLKPHLDDPFSIVTYTDREFTDFDTFQAQAGIQYRLKHWLSTSLRYTHRWRNSEFEDTINGNSIFLFLTTQIDTWPNFGLPKAIRRQSPGLNNPTSAFRD